MHNLGAVSESNDPVQPGVQSSSIPSPPTKYVNQAVLAARAGLGEKVGGALRITRVQSIPIYLLCAKVLLAAVRNWPYHYPSFIYTCLAKSRLAGFPTSIATRRF